MKKIIGILFLVISIVLCAVLGKEGYTKYKSYQENEVLYEQIKEIAKEPIQSMEEESVSSNRKINWNKLSGYDVIAWLEFGNIDYPIMQGADNQYYLNHAYDGTYNPCGSIFMNANNTPEDRNKIIYGHNVRSGKMFGTLKKYKEQGYGEDTFTLYFPDNTQKVYELYAVAEVIDGGPAYQYQFEDDKSYFDYLLKMKELSLYDTGIEPDISKDVVTLSTCSDYLSKKGHRVIVVGIEK